VAGAIFAAVGTVVAALITVVGTAVVTRRRERGAEDRDAVHLATLMADNLAAREREIERREADVARREEECDRRDAEARTRTRRRQ